MSCPEHGPEASLEPVHSARVHTEIGAGRVHSARVHTEIGAGRVHSLFGCIPCSGINLAWACLSPVLTLGGVDDRLVL